MQMIPIEGIEPPLRVSKTRVRSTTPHGLLRTVIREHVRMISEAAYEGNLGATEMFRFYEIARPDEQKEMEQFLDAGDNASAWKLLKRVTNTELVDDITAQTLER